MAIGALLKQNLLSSKSPVWRCRFKAANGDTDAGPSAEALLSYSQSGNPSAAHFADQTLLYADKTWRPVLFEPADIEAATESMLLLRSADQ